MASLDLHKVRAQFPALAQRQIYFDNAGGSQTLGAVAESIKSYLCTNNVQLGATYKVGTLSTEAYNKGLAAAAFYINAAQDEIVIGPSTTQLFRNLSLSLLPHLLRHPSPEFVVSIVDHEANIASWVFLQTLAPKLKIKYWKPSDSTTNPHLTAESLCPLLSENTVLVTCTHTSNILGTITPVRELADLVHTIPGAMICVDGVAFAPHRAVDVKTFGVDFYAFSWYKVFGPHISQLYCSRTAQDAAMTSLGHFFKDPHGLEEKLGLAAASYELLQSLPLAVQYIETTTWDAMVKQETAIGECLLKYLRSKPDVYTTFGEPTADPTKRVPVISFGIKGKISQQVVESVEKKTDFGFRWGHFYSKRLVDTILHLDEHGVTRVSLLHYNTVEEVEAYIEALDAEVCGSSS